MNFCVEIVLRHDRDGRLIHQRSILAAKDLADANRLADTLGQHVWERTARVCCILPQLGRVPIGDLAYIHDIVKQALLEHLTELDKPTSLAT